MDIDGIVSRFAGELHTHQGKLEGKAAESLKAQTALEQAAASIREQQDEHQQEVDRLLGGWDSKATDGLVQKAKKYDKQLAVTAEASEEAAKIVEQVTQALAVRHSNVGGLVEDFINKAAQFIKAGLAVVGITAPSGLMNALAGVADLAGSYLKESGGQLKDARAEMEEAARKLRALQKEIDSDGIADPSGEDRTSQGGGSKSPGGNDSGKDENKGKGKGSGKVEEILENARKHLGFKEGPNNQNKWGPTGQPWCAYFATSMWREAGVDIPKYGFTGDVYEWGERNGTAYDQDDIRKQVRPGDVLLFGSGPGHGQSTHIGIVEKVEGDTVTLIEGNSSGKVQELSYDLSKDIGEFYGGVHPK